MLAWHVVMVPLVHIGALWSLNNSTSLDAYIVPAIDARIRDALTAYGIFVLPHVVAQQQAADLAAALDQSVNEANQGRRWRFERIKDWESGRFDLAQPRTGSLIANGHLAWCVSLIGRVIESHLTEDHQTRERPQNGLWLLEYSSITSVHGATEQPFHDNHHSPGDFVTCQLYLEDTTSDMATLQFYPGSQVGRYVA